MPFKRTLTVIDLLVTCGDMARADFKSETLDFAYELAAGKPNSLDNPGRIFVKKDSSVVWVFSASECATWFVSGSQKRFTSSVLTMLGFYFSLFRILAHIQAVL